MKSYEQMGGDATGTMVMETIFAGYAEAGQGPNPGMGVWAWRTCYDIAAGLSVDQAIQKHLLSDTPGEMRHSLGLPPAESIVPPGGAAVITRDYCGNMCGVRIAGIQPVQGGAPDPSLVLSWFYDRYSSYDRVFIREEWMRRGYLDVLLSWPDSRAWGYTPEGFVKTCAELVSYGFRPCVMLLSKYYDPHHDVNGCLANVNAVLPQLLASKQIAKGCIGWELCLDRWIDPEELDQLTAAIAPQFKAAGVPCYVHFQQGYSHMDHDPGGTFGGYWSRQVGTGIVGILHQRDLSDDEALYQAHLVDILDRFSGKINVGIPHDCGAGHPFDTIALEITAMRQFDGSMTQDDGDRWGRVALATTPVTGPAGTLRIMGSGNGL